MVRCLERFSATLSHRSPEAMLKRGKPLSAGICGQHPRLGAELRLQVGADLVEIIGILPNILEECLIHFTIPQARSHRFSRTNGYLSDPGWRGLVC